MIDFIFYITCIIVLLISVSPFAASWHNYWLSKSIDHQKKIDAEINRKSKTSDLV